jgi:hypothetical protein
MAKFNGKKLTQNIAKKQMKVLFFILPPAHSRWPHHPGTRPPCDSTAQRGSGRPGCTSGSPAPASPFRCCISPPGEYLALAAAGGTPSVAPSGRAPFWPPLGLCRRYRRSKNRWQPKGKEEFI